MKEGDLDVQAVCLCGVRTALGAGGEGEGTGRRFGLLLHLPIPAVPSGDNIGLAPNAELVLRNSGGICPSFIAVEKDP